ncbi:hypothetical protein SeGA_2633 [Salmonella enterica subsp. enterica serovar Gaminara str. A4-567]|nr:hypothetical protein SeGA_2633 [Salmonella enterica subsp. enterica serovar Gaminara str. A4-567]
MIEFAGKTMTKPALCRRKTMTKPALCVMQALCCLKREHGGLHKCAVDRGWRSLT